LDALFDGSFDHHELCEALTMRDHYLLAHLERFMDCAGIIRNSRTNEEHCSQGFHDYEEGSSIDCVPMLLNMVQQRHVADWAELKLCWDFLKGYKAEKGSQLEEADMEYILLNEVVWKYLSHSSPLVSPSASTQPCSPLVSPSASTQPCSPLLSSSPSFSPPVTVQKRKK
jgi:hypothetical protein